MLGPEAREDLENALFEAYVNDGGGGFYSDALARRYDEWRLLHRPDHVADLHAAAAPATATR